MLGLSGTQVKFGFTSRAATGLGVLQPAHGEVDLTKAHLTTKAPPRVGCQQKFRDELERTRSAWVTMDLDGVLAHGQLPALGQDAHRHQMVADELLRQPSNG